MGSVEMRHQTNEEAGHAAHGAVDNRDLEEALSALRDGADPRAHRPKAASESVAKKSTGVHVTGSLLERAVCLDWVGLWDAASTACEKAGRRVSMQEAHSALLLAADFHSARVARAILHHPATTVMREEGDSLDRIAHSALLNKATDVAVACIEAMAPNQGAERTLRTAIRKHAVGVLCALIDRETDARVLQNISCEAHLRDDRTLAHRIEGRLKMVVSRASLEVAPTSQPAHSQEPTDLGV